MAEELRTDGAAVDVATGVTDEERPVIASKDV